MHALIQDGQIVFVGTLDPLWWDGTRWRDFREGQLNPADYGWLPVVFEPRPADTETTTWERADPALVEGIPTVTWLQRDKTPEELQADADNAAAQERALTHEAILDATTALMQDAHEDGQPWVQPQGAHDAYPLGITVTRDGKTWENITPANVWQPGVSGWREVVTGGGPAAWVAPTGGHDAYRIGDRVTYNGRLWESTNDANVWAPGVFGWTDLGPI